MKILDLCSGTGAWSKPFADAGYEVVYCDLKHGQDVRSFVLPTGDYYGVLAAPPCTEFAISGSRWWANKSPHLLLEAKEIVYCCLSLIKEANPQWWALENPAGRLRKSVPEVGKPNFSFQPYEYGDPWQKLTFIWGTVDKPLVTATQEDIEDVRMFNNTILDMSPWRLGPAEDRAEQRSITPPGFAQAFYDQVRQQFN